jgi:hypothetical protein
VTSIKYLELLWKKTRDKAIAKEIREAKQKDKEKSNTRRTINCLTIENWAIGHAIEKCAKIKFVTTWSIVVVQEGSNLSSIKKSTWAIRHKNQFYMGFKATN